MADAIGIEAQYTREFGADGEVKTVALSLEEHVNAEILQRVKPESTEEMDWYIRLAQELDDGEAQALAIAKVRGLILLTDDAKAARLAQSSALAVETTSTATVLKSWLLVEASHRVRIQEVVRRITILARFRPSKGDSAFEWWSSVLEGRTV